MIPVKFYGKPALLMLYGLFVLVFVGCKKDKPECDVINVSYDPNFVLFPKTGGLWIHTMSYSDTTFVDTFTVGLPANKLVYTMPFDEYDPSPATISSSPNTKEFYPLIREKTKLDTLGNIVGFKRDTVFWIREDLETKRVYRTLDYTITLINNKLFEMAYMDYDLKSGDVIRSYNNFYGSNYGLTAYAINGVDSIYFNKRYLKRYHTQMTTQKIIQGFDIAFGFYQMVNSTPARKKVFIYQNDSIVQNYY